MLERQEHETEEGERDAASIASTNVSASRSGNEDGFSINQEALLAADAGSHAASIVHAPQRFGIGGLPFQTDVEFANNFEREFQTALEGDDPAEVFNALLAFAKARELSSITMARTVAVLRQRQVVSVGVLRDWIREGSDALGEAQAGVKDALLNQELSTHASHAEGWRHTELAKQLATWVVRFNESFFSNELPPPAIAIERAHPSRLGSYHLGRDGLALRHRITINEVWAYVDPVDTLDTLVHELTHLWEDAIGGRRRGGQYHTAPFRRKMREIGIEVSPRGCTVKVVPDGPFLRLLKEHGIEAGVAAPNPTPGPQGLSVGSRATPTTRTSRWACGCERPTLIWLPSGVEIEALCKRCGEDFVRSAPTGVRRRSS